jgi:ferredoxin
VGCLDCLYVCPSLGVNYENTWFGKNKAETILASDSKRRDFIKKSIFIPAGLTALSKRAFTQGLQTPTGTDKGMVPIVRENPVTPPGSLSHHHFNTYCIACKLCVSACPTQVLQPSFLQYGLSGMMQPRMDFITSFCNFECTICTEVCPTGAIKPLEKETKKLTQVGISKFVKENCVVYTDETACGACSEHCPTKAVNMVPYDKVPGLMIPEVTEDICIGCGACEFACPTDPRSIYVEGNVEHVLAEKPKEEEIEKQELEEFPF